MTEYYQSRLQTILSQIQYMRQSHGDLLNIWPEPAQEKLYQLRKEQQAIENEKINDLHRP